MELYYIRTTYKRENDINIDFDYKVIRRYPHSFLLKGEASLIDEVFYFTTKKPKTTYKVVEAYNTRPIIYQTPTFKKIADVNFFCKGLKVCNKSIYKNISVVSCIDKETNYLKYLWEKFVLFRKLRRVVYKISCGVSVS